MNDIHKSPSLSKKATSERQYGSGRRLTHQRQQVFVAVEASGGHVSAEQVYTVVRKQLPQISLATVYRNLQLMVEMELLSRVMIEGVWLFEVNSGDHYHVVCLACGVVANIESSRATDIEEYLGRFTDFRLLSHELVLKGICPACGRR